jgi:transposase
MDRLKPMLPIKPRGVQRVNEVAYSMRSGAPWRDLLENLEPSTTCYNRFVRWPQAGIWDQIMELVAATHDGAVQMIDTSIVRMHQHGACIAGQQRTAHGPVARRTHGQDSCRGGR